MDLKKGKIGHLITEVIGCTVIEETGPEARAGSGAGSGAEAGAGAEAEAEAEADICLDHPPRSTTKVGAEAGLGPGLGAGIGLDLCPGSTAEVNIILMVRKISTLSQLAIDRKSIAHLQVVKPFQAILMVIIVSRLIQQPPRIVPVSRKRKIY